MPIMWQRQPKQKDWVREFRDPFDVNPQVYRNWLSDTMKIVKPYMVPNHVIQAWLMVLIRRRDVPNKKCYRPTRDLFTAIANHIIKPYLYSGRKIGYVDFPREPDYDTTVQAALKQRLSRPPHRQSTVDWF